MLMSDQIRYTLEMSGDINRERRPRQPEFCVVSGVLLFYYFFVSFRLFAYAVSIA